MIIDCISDLHGYYPEMKGGDLLIVAGDLTSKDEPWQYIEFGIWLNRQNYKKKIVVAGNHDNIAQKSEPFINPQTDEWEYLCDSGTEFEGLKIWGSPWTPWFKNVNPLCAAFMKPDKELSEYWKLIPHDTDILITHSPPYGILDGIPLPYEGTLYHAGSSTLADEIENRDTVPKLWAWGHIHEAYGSIKNSNCKMVNCSHVNGKYKPVNKPIRIKI